jgi:hypothetical protein
LQALPGRHTRSVELAYFFFVYPLSSDPYLFGFNMMAKLFRNDRSSRLYYVFSIMLYNIS